MPFDTPTCCWSWSCCSWSCWSFLQHRASTESYELKESHTPLHVGKLVILLGHAFLQHLHLLLLHCHVQTIHIKSHQIKITTFLQKFWVLLIFFVVCRFPLPVPLFYRFFCLLPVKHLCFQSPLLCSDEFPLTFPKTVRLWQEKCKKCMKFKNRWLLKPKVQKLRKVAEAEFVVA